MAYGGKRPNGPGSFDPGLPIQLAEGQAFSKAVIALPRGGVITGRVTDENGDPLTRVQVYTLFFGPGSSRGMRMGSGNQTDDLGQFRVYGLQPGDQAVVAEERVQIRAAHAKPKPRKRNRFVTTYYPAPREGAAARRTRAGTETTELKSAWSGSPLHLRHRRRFTGSAPPSRQRSGNAPHGRDDRVELRL